MQVSWCCTAVDTADTGEKTNRHIGSAWPQSFKKDVGNPSKRMPHVEIAFLISNQALSLGGGNSNSFYFHPGSLGEMIQFDYIIVFKRVGSTTN